MGDTISTMGSTIQQLVWEVAVPPAITDEPDLQPLDNVPIGSKVYVYKQDPTVNHIGTRVMWLPLSIQPGPTTDSVVVYGGEYGPTDEADNYMYDQAQDPKAFDAVHTLAVVEKVRLMYRRAIGKENWSKILRWQWGNRSPITVYTRAGNQANAYYERSSRSLNFFQFQSKTTGKDVYICRSWDTVAHETGHAILDGMKPGWIEPLYETTERGALHESFGDLTAIFSVLDQLDMCELIVAHTKGDLRNRQNVLAVIGEEFSQVEGNIDFGLRNAADNLKMSDAIDEIHDLSRVFTGAVYDVLVRIFMVNLNAMEFSPAETLYNVGKYLLAAFMFAIIEAPKRKVTFEDVGKLMIDNEPVELFRTFMIEEFTRRQIFDNTKKPKPYKAIPGVRRIRCCVA